MKFKNAILLAFIIAVFLGATKLALQNAQRQRAYVPQDLNLQQESDTMEVEGELVPDFPEFPMYPGAVIAESSQRQVYRQESGDVRAEWTADGTVMKVMDWYLKVLPNNGWTITELPDDRKSEGEQIVQFNKTNLYGTLIIEGEKVGLTKIVIDFAVTKL